MHITDIRQILLNKFLNKEIVTNDSGSLSGSDTIEIVSASFIADEPTIFGSANTDYIQHELDWYVSKSLNVNDIPGGAPKIWKAVASDKGFINSNYGFLIFDKMNGNQCENVIQSLINNQQTRRASMIYTRPTMHTDWNKDGMSDFICTNCVQYLIRDNMLHVVVQMRSNDAIFGFSNDYAWQKFVQQYVKDEYNVRTNSDLQAGQIYWNAASLHIYEKHFYYLDHFAKSKEIRITKSEYNRLYAK